MEAVLSHCSVLAVRWQCLCLPQTVCYVLLQED
uniref:Uncharacterized protein n=1 Tax=Anguilla anguilla TaxID=7936 RepID=A0A0E9UHG1_ANGAN